MRREKIIDNPALRERTYVFTDRHDAGRQLALLVRKEIPDKNLVVYAIPAGGVPVGTELARALNVSLEIAIVRKIRIPGNTEAGFGAVTWDGKVVLNERLVRALGLTQADITPAIAETKQNVGERIARFSGGKPFTDPAGKTVILTDDGLASGFTMLAAIAGISARNPAAIIVAVPTASASAADLVAGSVDQLICANIRSGYSFAVAEAYRQWYDLDDDEVIRELGRISDNKPHP